LKAVLGQELGGGREFKGGPSSFPAEKKQKGTRPPPGPPKRESGRGGGPFGSPRGGNPLPIL